MSNQRKRITREQWLELAIKNLRPLFKQRAQVTLPKNIKVTMSFPLGRSAHKVLGQSLSRSMSSGKRAELLINPTIGNPMRAMDVLVHELIHAYDNNKNGHKGPFQTIAKSMGLLPPWTATKAGKTLTKDLKAILLKMPPYPHKALNPVPPKKKQTTRMVKLECPSCGFICRASRMAVVNSGLPTCGCGQPMDLPDSSLFCKGGAK